jgi:hypothetical protein
VLFHQRFQGKETLGIGPLLDDLNVLVLNCNNAADDL